MRHVQPESLVRASELLKDPGRLSVLGATEATVSSPRRLFMFHLAWRQAVKGIINRTPCDVPAKKQHSHTPAG